MNPDILEQISFDDFIKIDIRLGKIVSVKNNDKSYKPSYLLQIDFGEKIGVKQSSAQITNYEKNELINKYVVCVVNFPVKKIAGYKSEVLVLGVDDEEGNISLISVDKPAVIGNKIY